MKIHVIKRKDGRYEARVLIDKYKYKSVYGKSESECRKKARALEKESIQYDLTNLKKMLLDDYMCYWLNSKKYSLKPSSYDRIMQSINYQIVPYLNCQITEIKPEDIENMLNTLAEIKSYSTIKKAYNNLNSCLKSAVQKGHIIKNPMEGIVLPKYVKQQTKDIRAYSTKEVKQIITECTRKYKSGKNVYRYGYLFILLLNTGMRLGESLFLKWKDVDLDCKQINIIGNLSEHKNSKGKGYTITETTVKTKASRRFIPLNSNAINALNNLRTIIRDDVRVISTQKHKPVSPHNIYRQFKCILKKCNIEANDIIHALRHTFATTLINSKKYTLKEVSELLGHSDVSTTANVYQHIIEASKIDAVKQLDDLFQ